MRSHEEQRQQKISQESSRQRETVKPSGYAGAPSSSSAQVAPSSREANNDLLERMLEGNNLRLYLWERWKTVKTELQSGTFRPMPVKRVEIPKPGGGVRPLGIPTVMDRLIQQALMQVMTPIFDPHFSPNSFGFRPRKRAHECGETSAILHP